jgi:hypothetical protein
LELEAADFAEVCAVQNEADPDDFAAWVQADLPDRIRSNRSYALQREMQEGRLLGSIREIDRGIAELQEHRATVEGELQRLQALPSLLELIAARRAAEAAAAAPEAPQREPEPIRIPTAAERRKGVQEPGFPCRVHSMPVVISEGADPAISGEAPTVYGA